jgi:Flp pilus assembly protein TadD
MRSSLAVTLGLIAVLLLGGCAGTGAARSSAGKTSLLASGTAQLYLATIEQMLDGDKVHAALAHLDEFDKRYGAQPASRKLRGDALLRTNDVKGAEAQYLALNDPAFAGDRLNGLGKVAAHRDDWSAAVRHFEGAAKANPTEVDFLNNLGFALIQTQDLRESEKVLRRAHELAPSNRRVVNNLVLLSSRADDPDRLAELVPDLGEASRYAPGELEALWAEYKDKFRYSAKPGPKDAQAHARLQGIATQQ